MEPRILRRARTLARGGSQRRGAVGGRSRVVIADSGATAEVLVFPPGQQLDRGAVFHYRGANWVITDLRRDSGILVAEPEAF